MDTSVSRHHRRPMLPQQQHTVDHQMQQLPPPVMHIKVSKNVHFTPRTPHESIVYTSTQVTSPPRLSPTETTIRVGKNYSPESLPPITTSIRLPSIHTRLSPTTQTPSPTTATTADRTRDLALRLALLLHARECCKGNQSTDRCSVQNCHIARGVLDHCQECFLEDGKCHVSCSQAKHLLRHFRICRARNFPSSCQICQTLVVEFPWAMQHAASLSPLFLQRSSPKGEAATKHENAPSIRRVVSEDPMLQRFPFAPPATSGPLPPAKRQRSMPDMSTCKS